MVAGRKTDTQLLKKVADLYNRLDLQISNNSDLSGLCDACGKCCDFAQFDHRLFVTTPELMYLAANLGAENIKGSRFAIHRKMGSEPMPAGRCPYQMNGKCAIYKYRFAGCRVFCCSSEPDFQSTLSESVLKELKSVCTEFQIPYRYNDLATALNSFVG